MRFYLSIFREDVIRDTACNIPTDILLGELLLIYNENLEFIDENWDLDINSPFIEVLRSKDNF